MNRKWPIKDIQFHEEALRETADDVLDHDQSVIVAWHTTAIAYLQYGQAMGLDGPGTESWEGKKAVPVRIDHTLTLAYDQSGHPNFHPTFLSPPRTPKAPTRDEMYAALKESSDNRKKKLDKGQDVE